MKFHLHVAIWYSLTFTYPEISLICEGSGPIEFGQARVYRITFNPSSFSGLDSPQYQLKSSVTSSGRMTMQLVVGRVTCVPYCVNLNWNLQGSHNLQTIQINKPWIQHKKISHPYRKVGGGHTCM